MPTDIPGLMIDRIVQLILLMKKLVPDPSLTQLEVGKNNNDVLLFAGEDD